MGLRAVSTAQHSCQLCIRRDRVRLSVPRRKQQYSQQYTRHRTSSYRFNCVWGIRSAEEVSATTSSSVSVVPPGDQLLEVGRVLTTHGIKGELKVEALTDFPEQRFTVPGIRWLQAGALDPKECFLERGRSTISKGREIWIVKLRGVNSLNDSQLLRGTTLLVNGADRPELEDEDEFLAQDLIGASVVFDNDGSNVGTVLDVYDGTGPGAHDLLNIQLSQKMLQSNSESKTMLLPFVKDFVPVVDVEDNVIHICPPAGLMDMALQPTVKSKKAPKVPLVQ